MKPVRKYWLKARYPDGSAEYRMKSSDGSSGLLIVHADGSRFYHVIEGVDFDKALGGELGAVRTPVTTPPPEPVQGPVQGPVQVAHTAPVVEPERASEPAPEPVDDQLSRDARMVARSVWFHGGRTRSLLFEGRSRMAADEILERAVQRGWVTVKGEDMIVPGTVNPVPTMPVVERSRVERILAWGPTKGARW
jgi:hypothetical protein